MRPVPRASPFLPTAQTRPARAQVHTAHPAHDLWRQAARSAVLVASRLLQPSGATTRRCCLCPTDSSPFPQTSSRQCAGPDLAAATAPSVSSAPSQQAETRPSPLPSAPTALMAAPPWLPAAPACAPAHQASSRYLCLSRQLQHTAEARRCTTQLQRTAEARLCLFGRCYQGRLDSSKALITRSRRPVGCHQVRCTLEEQARGLQQGGHPLEPPSCSMQMPGGTPTPRHGPTLEPLLPRAPPPAPRTQSPPTLGAGARLGSIRPPQVKP